MPQKAAVAPAPPTPMRAQASMSFGLGSARQLRRHVYVVVAPHLVT